MRFRDKTGSYTGDGSSAVNVDLGFQPKVVEIYDYTDALVVARWIEGMPAASALLVIDSGVGTTDLSKITSAGITVGSTGFKVGTNANLIKNNKVYYWTAR